MPINIFWALVKVISFTSFHPLCCLLRYSNSSVKVHSLPLPYSLFAQISPPRKSRSFLLRYRPNPVPSWLFVRDTPICWKGWLSRSLHYDHILAGVADILPSEAYFSNTALTYFRDLYLASSFIIILPIMFNNHQYVLRVTRKIVPCHLPHRPRSTQRVVPVHRLLDRCNFRRRKRHELISKRTLAYSDRIKNRSAVYRERLRRDYKYITM